MGNDEKIKSTAVMTDIRNFSETFKYYQIIESDEFLHFLDLYYASEKTIADVLSDNYHMSLIGDGILTVFMGKDHHRLGYAYLLASHRLLTKLCDNFPTSNAHPKISFGLGADSGNVNKRGLADMETYVGTVINRASRLQECTKLFARAKTAVGNSLYKKLIKDFYPETHKKMELYETYDEMLDEDSDAVMVSKKFMLYYIFDMALKGVQSDAPVFRISQHLVKKDELFWDVMEMLLDDDKVKRLKLIL